MVHQREEEDGEALLEDQTPTLKIHPEELRTETQIPRNPKPVTSRPALPFPPGFHLWRSSVRDSVIASYEYVPDAAHTWITAVEKPTATFDLMSMCGPHFAAPDAKLIEAINTLRNSRNYDLARQLINMKETAVKKCEERSRSLQREATLVDSLRTLQS